MSSVNSVATSPASSFLQNSTSTVNSLAVSSSSSATSYTRCQGLDLLLKAVYYVDNSIIGVPFVRKRVLIRRRRRSAAAYAFSDFVLNELFRSGRLGRGCGESESGSGSVAGKVSVGLRDPVPKAQRRMRRRREMTLPMKYRDSVIETWKSQTRTRINPSIQISGGDGSDQI